MYAYDEWRSNLPDQLMKEKLQKGEYQLCRIHNEAPGDISLK